MAERNQRDRGSEGDRAELGRERSEAAPPPGAGVVNSDRGGHVASDNPVLRTGRDAGDVLGDRMLEDDPGEDARRR